MLKTETHFVPLDTEAKLHVRRFYVRKKGPPVLMLHGAIENGRIFYSQNKKGLAPFLALAGFDVFVADLRGRGQSKPRVAPFDDYGQTESIKQEIPALDNFVRRTTGVKKYHWLAHSWGGVLMFSTLARYPSMAKRLLSITCLGTKRCIRVLNAEKFFKIDLFWLGVAPLIAKVLGYLPAHQLRLGSDVETMKSLKQSGDWVRPGPWVDSEDGFDYSSALRKVLLPPSLFLAGAGDACLGNPLDVSDFITELAHPKARSLLLSKKNGFCHDYDHISLLTHPDAVEDHFVLIEDWLKRAYKKL